MKNELISISYFTFQRPRSLSEIFMCFFSFFFFYLLSFFFSSLFFLAVVAVLFLIFFFWGGEGGVYVHKYSSGNCIKNVKKMKPDSS